MPLLRARGGHGGRECRSPRWRDCWSCVRRAGTPRRAVVRRPSSCRRHRPGPIAFAGLTYWPRQGSAPQSRRQWAQRLKRTMDGSCARCRFCERAGQSVLILTAGVPCWPLRARTTGTQRARKADEASPRTAECTRRGWRVTCGLSRAKLGARRLVWRAEVRDGDTDDERRWGTPSTAGRTTRATTSAAGRRAPPPRPAGRRRGRRGPPGRRAAAGSPAAGCARSAPGAAPP